MDLYILNREEKVVGVLSNEGENNFLSSAVLTDELNKIKTLDLEVASISTDVEQVKEENFILLKDITEAWNLFIIKEVSEVHGNDTVKTVYCEDSSQELLDEVFQHEQIGRAHV